MAIDNVDRIDIRKLTVESPKPPTAPAFNPETDVSQKDWEKILKYVQKLAKETGENNKFYNAAHYLCPVFPEKRNQLGLDGEKLNDLKNKFVFYSQKDSLGALITASQTKNLFGKRVEELDNLDDLARNFNLDFEDMLRDYAPPNAETIAMFLAHHKVLFPEKVPNFRNHGSTQFFLENEFKMNDPLKRAKFLADLKVAQDPMFPNNFKDENLINAVKGKLGNLTKQGKIIDLIYAYYSLSVLCAKSVYTDEEGLHIIRVQNPQEPGEIPQLPEVKKYAG